MKVFCLSCSEEFAQKKKLERHVRSGVHRLSCLHTDGKQRHFQSAAALQQHLVDSVYHAQHLRNVKINVGKDGGKRKAPSQIRVEQPPQESRWTNIVPSLRPIELGSLRSKVHPYHRLSELGFFDTGDMFDSDYMQNFLEKHTPTPRPWAVKRGAVALDCEMVATKQNENELARLSAIDYLTGEVLIDTLVKPAERVIDWRSTVTGITQATMASAEAHGKVFYGWEAGRAELWNFIDSDTILVGQALIHDFRALRIVHPTVVDLAILTSEVVNLGRRQWALKTLCSELTAVPIREGLNATHDSLEDAYAAREVVLWCLRNEDGLSQWALKKRKAIQIEQSRRKFQRELDLKQRLLLMRAR